MLLGDVDAGNASRVHDRIESMRFEQPLESRAIANVELHVGCTGVVGTKVQADDRPPRRHGLEETLAEEAGYTRNQDGPGPFIVGTG